MQTHFKTIIVSDIHLGTKGAKDKLFFEFLENNTCETLILNGDIIDGRHVKIFGGRPQSHSKIFQILLNKIEKNQTNIYYLPGNHDEFLKNLVPLSYEKINLQKDLIYTGINGKKYYICHGDVFDKVEGKLYMISYLSFVAASMIYRIDRNINNIFEKLGLKKIGIVANIKRFAKILMVGGKDTYHRKLTAMAKKYKCQGIICGHIHKVDNIMIDNIHYLNSGDWIESLTAITEDFDGNRNIYYKQNKLDK